MVQFFNDFYTHLSAGLVSDSVASKMSAIQKSDTWKLNLEWDLNIKNWSVRYSDAFRKYKAGIWIKNIWIRKHLKKVLAIQIPCNSVGKFYEVFE